MARLRSGIDCRVNGNNAVALSVATGNLVLVAVAAVTGTLNGTITDSQSNTYTLDAQNVVGVFTISHYHTVATATGTLTVSALASSFSNSYHYIGVEIRDDTLAGTPVLQSATAVENTGTNPISLTVAGPTTTAAGSFAIVLFASNGDTYDVTTGLGGVGNLLNNNATANLYESTFGDFAFGSVTWGTAAAQSAYGVQGGGSGYGGPNGIQAVAYTVVASGGTANTKSLSGTITPAGTLARKLSAVRTLTGTITPAGTLARVATFVRTLTGSTTPTGTLTRAATIRRTLTGAVTPAGTLAQLRVRLLSLSGAISPAGTLLKLAVKRLIGSTTPGGAKTQQTAKRLTGTMTPAGIVTTFKARLLALTSTLSPSGTIARLFSGRQAFVSSISLVGVKTSQIAKRLTGTLTPAGALAALKTRLLAFTSAVTPSAALARVAALRLMLSSALTPQALKTSLLRRTLTSALTITAALGSSIGGTIVTLLTRRTATVLSAARTRLAGLLGRSSTTVSRTPTSTDLPE